MTDKPTPTDAEILDAAEDFRSQYTHGGTTFDEFDEIGFTRAVLAKWGQPAQAAEPVAAVVPCHTPSGKRVALYSAKQDLPIGTKLYAAPQPSYTAQAANVQEDAADPLQGAANWLAEAHGQFSPVVLSGCLMIGYNRAKRLHDAALAARKQGEKQ